MRYKPIVSIHCLVYNHEPYLRQCLDGFVMQKTDFAFEAIVHDDCSTDGSAAIIREYAEKYPEIIKSIYETENQFSKIGFPGINSIMIAHSKGKYIALCEGDDYWTDPNKLQKQVDYMELHPECGLIYTQIQQYNEKEDMFHIGWSEGAIFDEMLIWNRVCTLSTCFRRYLYDKYQKEICPSKYNWLMGDYPLWLYLFAESKVQFLKDITGVYRLHYNNSLSHINDFNKHVSFVSSFYDISRFFAIRYGKSKLLPKIIKCEVIAILQASKEYNNKPPMYMLKKMVQNKFFNIQTIALYFLHMNSLSRSFLINKKNKKQMGN